LRPDNEPDDFAEFEWNCVADSVSEPERHPYRYADCFSNAEQQHDYHRISNDDSQSDAELESDADDVVIWNYKPVTDSESDAVRFSDPECLWNADCQPDEHS
jgi:hypothetical protein